MIFKKRVERVPGPEQSGSRLPRRNRFVGILERDGVEIFRTQLHHYESYAWADLKDKQEKIESREEA